MYRFRVTLFTDDLDITESDSGRQAVEDLRDNVANIADLIGRPLHADDCESCPTDPDRVGDVVRSGHVREADGVVFCDWLIEMIDTRPE